MYSMKECCRLTGLSYDTLKFYCNQGLVPNVKRGRNNNYREFDEDDINWIKGLICLKRCDFSIKEMKEYMQLCKRGKSTIVERKNMLNKHKKLLEEKILKLQEASNYIDEKNKLYDKFLSGETEYFSYFIKKDEKINRL